MEDAHKDKLGEKAAALLAGAAASDVARALREPDRQEARDAIKAALLEYFEDEAAYTVAFHLIDWTPDAAFVLAAAMFPKSFTEAELEEGVLRLLEHMPAHIAAATKVAGVPCEDIWDEKPGKPFGEDDE